MPAGTPAAIVDKLNAGLKRALEDPAVASALAARTFNPAHTTSGEFAARLKADYEKYGRLINQTGAKHR